MDPYSPPAPIHTMPRQPSLYSSLTLTGNWFERQILAVDLANYQASQRAKKALDIDHRIRIYRQSQKKFAETSADENDHLFFGDSVHLSCIGTVPPTGHSTALETPSLAIDLHMASVEDSGLARAYASLKDAEPKGRSVFTIKSEDLFQPPSRTRQVRFGDSIYLVSAVAWQGMEWRLTSALEHLYDVNLLHRKQTVWLSPLLTKKSLWSFQHVDKNLRAVMEGQPVDIRQPVLLRHVLSGRNMTVNFLKKFRTAYGVEYLMTCDQDRDIHKMEKENAMFHIRKISLPPQKLDDEKEMNLTFGLEEQTC